MVHGCILWNFTFTEDTATYVVSCLPGVNKSVLSKICILWSNDLVKFDVIRSY